MKTDDKKEQELVWTTDELEQRWTALIEAAAKEDGVEIPAKRLRHQAEVACQYNDIRDTWADMDDMQRKETWKVLCESVPVASKEMLAMCVQCGICCNEGSPTLMEEDLELLQDESIPWNRLVTLREGEPAHSPFTDEVFYLPEERIKLREVPGTKTCVLYDTPTTSCTIHVNRPMQCRAQECWDDEPAKLLVQQPVLTRSKLFESVGVLAEMIEEHDRRFSFKEMRDLFEELKETEGKSADKVVDFLAFEEHYRNFVAEKLSIPVDTLDLVFGRALSEMVKLFGFAVDANDDGTKTLRPETS